MVDMQTFYIPEESFPDFIKAKGIGTGARTVAVDGKIRYAVKIEAGEYIIRPIPKQPKTLLEKIKALI